MDPASQVYGSPCGRGLFWRGSHFSTGEQRRVRACAGGLASCRHEGLPTASWRPTVLWCRMTGSAVVPVGASEARELDHGKRNLLRTRVVSWASTHLRPFPWRPRDRSVYEVLIAESLLKRTTAAAAVRLYEPFLALFPSVSSIDDASTERLAGTLSAVGLHQQRARAMKRMAQYLVEEHGGMVPCTLNELLAVPGVGQYSARAVLSFGCHVPVAAVDANVERVLSRVFQAVLPPRPTAKALQALADSLLPVESHREYNYGLLDLGALVCRYIGPLHAECPLTEICDHYAAENGAVQPPPKPVGGVGTWLRNERSRRGMTLTGLAHASGVSKLTIIRIESGKTVPRPDTLGKLSAALTSQSQPKTYTGRAAS